MSTITEAALDRVIEAREKYVEHMEGVERRLAARMDSLADELVATIAERGSAEQELEELRASRQQITKTKES